jgi:hypothetical protein
MANMRGEKIIVRAWGDRPLVRVVWDICDQTVLVTNEEGLVLLENGAEAPMPIGFRFCDVFIYDEDRVEKIMKAYVTGDQLKWESLQRFRL